MAINFSAASFAACLAGLKVPRQIMYCIAQGTSLTQSFKVVGKVIGRKRLLTDSLERKTSISRKRFFAGKNSPYTLQRHLNEEKICFTKKSHQINEKHLKS